MSDHAIYDWPTEHEWSQMRPAERWERALRLLRHTVRWETQGKILPTPMSRALELADQALEERP